MKVINDNLSLRNFDAWAGAKDTKELIIENGKESDFEFLMSSCPIPPSSSITLFFTRYPIYLQEKFLWAKILKLIRAAAPSLYISYVLHLSKAASLGDFYH